MNNFRDSSKTQWKHGYKLFYVDSFCRTSLAHFVHQHCTPEYTNRQEIFILRLFCFSAGQSLCLICCITIGCEHMVSLTNAHTANSFIRDVTSESSFHYLPVEEADRKWRNEGHCRDKEQSCFHHMVHIF